tara:strand:- start:785 stop:973 length:189 start_codon:yes stop_codon:yes gene_type:complete
MNKIVDLVCASDFEEFFYKEDDMPVSEGQPVGVDLDCEDEVQFVLFDDIYWSFNHGNEEEEV